MYEYSSTIDRVVDGDTVDVNIDLGFKVWVLVQRVRLNGIDTPESRTRNKREKYFGKIATARVKELLPKDQRHVMRTSKGSRGKFGRVLADFILPNGLTLCDTLVTEQLAVKYHGQSKDDVWAAHLANFDALEKCVDGWRCEIHSKLGWPHNDCIGPGIPCLDVGCESSIVS